MSVESTAVTAVRMPQVNVNDQEVRLVGWSVVDGGRVDEGNPLCEVETSKAVGEVPAPATGVVTHIAKIGEIIAVGDVFAYIGSTREAIETYRAGLRSAESGGAKPQAVRRAAVSGPGGEAGMVGGATAGAVELARRWDVDLAQVPAQGRIRRADVEQFIAQRGLRAPTKKENADPQGREHLPAALAVAAKSHGQLSEHQWAIARHLQATQERLLVGHVVMEAGAEALSAWMAAKRRAGVMTGPIPIILLAAAEAVRANDKLRWFRLGREIYRYDSLDIAFTARSGDGRLFTPVVRGVESRAPDDLATECGRLSIAVFRGSIQQKELAGACMTVSVLSDQPVRLHVGLQNAYQSTLLTAGAIEERVVMRDGRPASQPVITLALTYDHGLLDGAEAAECLAAAKSAIEGLKV